MNAKHLVDSKLQSRLASRAPQACCECGARGPDTCDLTHLSWVCVRCAGLLREFSFRTKSIRLSRLTREEISSMETAPYHDALTEAWLASYPPSARRPRGTDTDEVLKGFLRSKYVDKKWLDPARMASVTAEARTRAATAPPCMILNTQNNV